MVSGMSYFIVSPRYFYRKLFLLSAFLCIIRTIGCDCVIVETADDPDENKREQELLKTIQPLKDMEFTVDDQDGDKKYTYRVRICDTVRNESTGVGAVQHSLAENFVLGLYTAADITNGTDWLMLTYYNGSTHTGHCSASDRITRIMIICDSDNLKGAFRILEEKKRSNNRYCFYLFELSSSVACTNHRKPSPGMTSGGVFCILFFTFAGIYFILGFFYQRLVAGAKGLEQIPNYTFWRSFGNLQADGCDYVCRCGPRQESQAYRGIDDRLKAEDERDDQLLNM